MVIILHDVSEIGAQSLSYNMFKAFYRIENSNKSDIFSLKRPIFLHACATYSE